MGCRISAPLLRHAEEKENGIMKRLASGEWEQLKSGDVIIDPYGKQMTIA